MTKSSIGSEHSFHRTGIRIVVAGDARTGKSSLITTVSEETFFRKVPPVLQPTKLPDELCPYGVPITIIDTSARIEDRDNLTDELVRSDVVVLTYACDQPETLARLSTFWFPELCRLEVKVPVILVGCKLDLRNENDQGSLEAVMSPLMNKFREIETCIECSASNGIQITEVFFYAQKAVLHPTAPLFDQETQTLKPQCMRALKHIFIICDRDKDGFLNDSELNTFQERCFGTTLQPSEIHEVKRVVKEKFPEGANECGLTLTGFFFLHALFIEKGRLETTWTVLRRFGYGDDVCLNDDLLPSSLERNPEQSVELTSVAVDFLKEVFYLFDCDGDGLLNSEGLNDLFSTAPESPWMDAPYKDAAVKTSLEGLPLDGFLAKWMLMTNLDPAASVKNLIYIGYEGDLSSAIRVTKKRRAQRKRHMPERGVFQCFVFGAGKSGKSTLLNSLVGRPFSLSYSPTTDIRYSVNDVDMPDKSKKTLILKEIPEGQVGKLMADKYSLACCDIAIFVYDSSDEVSWKKTAGLLSSVVSHGENTGFMVPCLLAATKNDLPVDPLTRIESAMLCEDLALEHPVYINLKSGLLNNLFQQIVSVASKSNLNIPETEASRTRKRYYQIMNHSLVAVSVGAAVVMLGVAVYRVYMARRSSSSSGSG